MSDATLNSTQSGWYSKGSRLTLVCYKRGQAVKGYFSPWVGNGGWDDLWYKTADGYFAADIDLDTGSNSPVTEPCTPVKPAAKYDRYWAAYIATQEYRYAMNPFLSNCTLFASYVLNRGGVPKTAAWTDSSSDKNQLASKIFNPGPTKRWASADYFKNYVVNEAKLGTLKQVSLGTKNPGAQVGDFILYDWGPKPNGIVDHIAVVTGVASDGTLTVTQQQPSQTNRKWNWSLSAGKPIAQSDPGTRVYVINITY